jgi:hypothetical protein
MPLLGFLESFEPLIVINVLLCSNSLEHILNSRHHSLETTEVDVCSVAKLVENLIGVFLYLVLDVHLSTLLVLLFTGESVVDTEVIRVLLLCLLELVIVKESIGVSNSEEKPCLSLLFAEETPAAAAYKGQAWLFLGVANSDALLYDDEFQEAKKKNPDNFRIDYALSREQENKKGGKMYIQDKVEEYADEVFDKLSNGAHIYFCGLKGMMPGIQDMLKGVAAEKDIDYDEWLKGLKKSKQWHVEVY